jgi:O-antigen/teichoic acid export membrane protein
MFKNIVSTFFTRFFIAFSNLIIAVLLSNFIGAAGRGEQSLIITLITIIIIITSVIGASSIAYLLPRFRFMALIIPSYIWVSLVIFACFFVIPLLGLVPEEYNTDICLLSLLLAIQNINSAVLISKQRINAANWVGFFQSFVIILVLLVYFLLLDNRSIHAYLIALYAGYGSSLLLSFFLIIGYFEKVSRDSLSGITTAFKKLVVLGVFNQIAVFTQLLSFRLSYYILDGYFGKETVGIYSNAVSIAESIWLVGRSIGTVQHSKIVNNHDISSSLNLTSRMNKLNLIFSVILLLVVSCIPSAWYVWIFGDEFTHINRIIWTLGPGILFFGVVMILGYYFSSTGKQFVNAIASASGLVFTVIVGFILIPRWGSYGAGITASISYGITALVVVYYYLREKKLHK